jgi:hypothetical protein
MIARGWIDTYEVRRALFAAAEANGQVKEYGLGHFNDTFKDGIARGISTPHPELPDDSAGIAQGPNGLREPFEGPPSGGEPPRRLIKTLAKFLSELEIAEYLVDGIIKRGFLYSLTAKTGAGKTAIALLLAVIIADRKCRWKFGPYEVEHGRVIYVTRENPDEVRERLIGMAERMGFECEELELSIIDDVSDISKEFEQIKREAGELGDVAAIVLDTSAALFVGTEENSNTEMLKHAKIQRQLTKLPGRPSVIALNHPVKNPAGPEQLIPRGGSSYLNEVDGNFTLWGHDDRLSDFHWTGKIRGPEFEKMTFRMITVITMKLADKKGRPMPTVMAQIATDEDINEEEAKAKFQENRLLNAMKKTPEGSIADLAKACGWVSKDGKPHKSLVFRVLSRLVKAKLITKVGRGYELTKAGKKELAGGRKQTEEGEDDRDLDDCVA